MHIRCPHCHHAIEIVGDEPFTDVTCPSCGSAFSLVPETESYTPTTQTIGHFAKTRAGKGQERGTFYFFDSSITDGDYRIEATMSLDGGDGK